MTKDYFPIQFQLFLDACSTHEQRQCFIQIREQLLANNTIQEYYGTRHLKYGKQKNEPCLEMKFNPEWSHPKVFFTLIYLNRSYQWETEKCQYAGTINAKGELSPRLYLYHLPEMTFKNSYRQLDKVLEILLEKKVNSLSNQLKIKTLVEYSILFDY